MNALKNTHTGLIMNISYDKTADTILVLVNTVDGGSRVLRHKVGAMQGLTKSESRTLWYDLHRAQQEEAVVEFYHRGTWSHYFDAIVETNPELVFA